MSVSIIGGLLLVLGAWFTLKGNVYHAVMIYFLADICWVILTYHNQDWFGTTVVAIGMILGLLAFLKMNTGRMRKDLNNNETD